MKINWKLRAKNPWFWIGLIGVVFSPVLAVMGISQTDLTSWDGVLNVLKTFVTTPYLVFSAICTVLSFFGISADPTTSGLGDSNRAMTYDKPKAD